MKDIKRLFGILTITAALAMQVHAQSWLTNGLVHYYPFNNNANDMAGANNGAVSFATLSTDRFGRPNSCYSFDGVSSFIDFGTNLNLGNPYGAWTISVWFLTLGDGHVFTDYEGTSSGGDSIFAAAIAIDSNPIHSPAHYLAVGSRHDPPINGDYSIYCSQNTIADNRWHSVAYEMDGLGSCYVFVDGQPVQTLYYMPQLSYIENPHWRAGGGVLFAGQRQYFTGLIDDVRIYNRALSTNEVQQLYAYRYGPVVTLLKAVKPSFTGLLLGTNYQLQVSADLNTWTNQAQILA